MGLALGSVLMVLHSGFVQLADIFQLDAQAMSQGAFGAKLIEQCFRLFEGVW